MTKKCYLIGNPVEHSLSDGMHQIIYDKLGLSDWLYEKKLILDTSQLKDFSEKVSNSPEIVGFNITIPYKQDIMHYVSPTLEANTIGAVNTVVKENGKLVGHNTDWKGFIWDFKNNLLDEIRLSKVLLLGAGGVSRAILWALIKEKVSEIYIYDKDKSRVNELISELQLVTSETAIMEISLSKIESFMQYIDILINATPIGMHSGDQHIFSLKDSKYKQSLLVYDVVYNRITELLNEAAELGLKNSGGIGMLAGQGIEAFKMWSGLDVDLEIADEIKDFLRKEVEK